MSQIVPPTTEFSTAESSKVKKLLYVFEVGPYSSSVGAEALESALIGATLEQDLSLLFLHDGVFQIKRDQISVEGQSQYTKTFRALADFDINKVFAHDLSLLARGLTVDDLMIDIDTISSADIAELIAAQDRVFTF